ncbi:hypothetical protein L210DRAFT_3503188 [Boletus edulis BED1]|uniref:Uncharacterized protein n=1 Tax=Boletus edulis BED1 TaxID=1328754 RepID=A0AAD4GGB9_BOLED|nr:hypothetical protein L210DRAFT_3503188 [Boletus edulis BED1]
MPMFLISHVAGEILQSKMHSEITAEKITWCPGELTVTSYNLQAPEFSFADPRTHGSQVKFHILEFNNFHCNVAKKLNIILGRQRRLRQNGWAVTGIVDDPYAHGTKDPIFHRFIPYLHPFTGVGRLLGLSLDKPTSEL